MSEYRFSEKYPEGEGTIPCNNADEFIAALSPLDGKYDEGDWFFRGQCNAAWTLRPSISRDNKLIKRAEYEISCHIAEHPSSLSSTIIQWKQAAEKCKISADGLCYFRKQPYSYFCLLWVACAWLEFHDVTQFISRSNSSGLYVPNFNFHDSLLLSNSIDEVIIQMSNHIMQSLKGVPEDGTIENVSVKQLDIISNYPMSVWYALAQHHGIKTRLLDWTQNSYCAAYFACHGQDSPSEKIVVWAVRQDLLPMERMTVWIRHISTGNDYFQAQSARFSYERWLSSAPHLFYKREACLDTTLTYLIPGKNIFRITLPSKEIEKLTYLLQRLNIRKSTLQPSYDHVAAEINDEIDQTIEDMSINLDET